MGTSFRQNAFVIYYNVGLYIIYSIVISYRFLSLCIRCLFCFFVSLLIFSIDTNKLSYIDIYVEGMYMYVFGASIRNVIRI